MIKYCYKGKGEINMTKKEIINSNRPIADYVANTSPYVFTLHHIEYGIDDYAYVFENTYCTYHKCKIQHVKNGSGFFIKVHGIRLYLDCFIRIS